MKPSLKIIVIGLPILFSMDLILSAKPEAPVVHGEPALKDVFKSKSPEPF